MIRKFRVLEKNMDNLWQMEFLIIPFCLLYNYYWCYDGNESVHYLKPFPLMLLLLINNFRDNKRYTRTLNAVFTAALIGDIFLIGDYIVLGLISFLIAHIFLLKYLTYRFSSETITSNLILSALSSYLFIKKIGWFIPGNLFYGVWIYGTILLTNYIFSFIKIRKNKYRLFPVAMSFLLYSDIILGYELFGFPIMEQKYFCMRIISFYWLGMLILSLMGSLKPRPEPMFDYEHDTPFM